MEQVYKLVIYYLETFELGEIYIDVFANPRGFVPEINEKVYPSAYYKNTLKRMARQGWVKESLKQGERFIKLTKKGKLQALLQKLKSSNQKIRVRDGWQLIVFDIPETGSYQRYLLRSFLKTIDFHQLQKSIYISPYRVSQEAIEYLKDSGLIKYIRIFQVKEVDNDFVLRKTIRSE